MMKRVLMAVVMVWMAVCVWGEILPLNIVETWTGNDASTATLTLTANGTLKSLLVDVPACDGARFAVQDVQTGYRLQSLTSLTTGTATRTALSGEFCGAVQLLLWCDPTNGTPTTTVTGRMLYEK